MPRFRKSCGANVLGQPLWMGILDVSQRLLRCFINQKYYLDNETRASIFRTRMLKSFYAHIWQQINYYVPLHAGTST